MSIISDALKKAAEKRRGGDRAGVPPPAFPQRRYFRGARAAAAGAVVAAALLFPALFLAGKKSDGAPARPIRFENAQFSVEDRPILFGAGDAVFALSGIARIDGARVAIVNGTVVREGDRVEGARVAAIDDGMVQLEVEGRRITLEMGL